MWNRLKGAKALENLGDKQNNYNIAKKTMLRITKKEYNKKKR